jgi:hypothetical protein
MTQFTPGLIVEVLLVVLLMLTVGYCILLNRRLSNLRSSQQELRQIVSDLATATTTAESAIRGLRATTDDAEARLSDKMQRAELLSRELSSLTDSRPERPIDQPPPRPEPRPTSPESTVRGPASSQPAGADPRSGAGASRSGDTDDRDAWRRHALSRLKQAS